ncbi:MAG: glycosyltransferase [Flavobacteriales bacterium]|nr:glycosyltransferase [Flavobacteriales bacterium]
MLVRVWLVIPCFNEALRLRPGKFKEFAAKYPNTYLCFVDDGSTDNTLALLQDLARNKDQLTVLHMPVNGGKGEAVRQGILYGLLQKNFEVFGYWDADLATPLSELENLCDTLASNENLKLVAGSRYLSSSNNIRRSTVRQALGKVFALLSRWYTGLPMRDSQCGAKLMQREAAAIAFDRPFHSRWVFDVEVLLRLKRKFGRSAIGEVALHEWQERGGGSLSAKHYWKVPLELLRLGLRR